MADVADINTMILAHLDKNSTIGIGYLGVVVSSIVYGITCVQTFQYYRSARAVSDMTLLRLLVLILWILDTIQESFAIHVFYFYLIDNFGNASGLLLEVWSMPAGVLTNAVISLMVKMFLTMRVWRLSGHNVSVTSVCVVVNSARFVMNVYFPVRMFAFKDLFEAEAKLQRIGVAGLALEVAADVVVSASLVYYLVTSRSGIRRSDNMLSRLIALTVATGMLSTCVAIANLVSYIVAPDALYVLFFDFLIAKLDANALMTSLNSRDFVRDGSHASTSRLGGITDVQSVPLSVLRVPLARVHAGSSTTMEQDLPPYGIVDLKVDADRGDDV